MSTMTVSEARAALPRLLDRVGEGDEVTITRHGKAVAVLVRPDTLRVRRVGQDVQATADAIRDAIHPARRGPLPARSSLTPEEADRWVEELHADRRRR